MKLKILSLNCQKNYQKELIPFLKKILKNVEYDILLLQESTKEVLKPFHDSLDYSIVSTKDDFQRDALVSVVYNKKLEFNKFNYKPILIDSFEKNERKKPYQSFGVIRAEFTFNGLNIVFGSIHLPSGFSCSRRIKSLNLAKEFMKGKKSDLIIFAGDCNFCVWGEDKNAGRIVKPDFVRISKDLPHTLESFYTESNLPYSWVKINDYLRKCGINLKFKTDQVFVSSNVAKDFNPEIKVLKDRVSDHSPVEIILNFQ